MWCPTNLLWDKIIPPSGPHITFSYFFVLKMEWHINWADQFAERQYRYTQFNELSKDHFANKTIQLRRAEIILGRDPWTSKLKERIRLFPWEHNLINDLSTSQPQAAICASKDLQLWPMTEFTDVDVVTCLWRNGQDHQGEIVIIFCYLGISLYCVWPQALKRVTSHC